MISNQFSVSFECGDQTFPQTDLIKPCDSFFGGFLKEKILPKRPQTLLEMQELRVDACDEITEDMCHRVVNNLWVRVEEVDGREGGHIEHVISWTQSTDWQGTHCILIICISVKIKVLKQKKILNHFLCNPVLYFKRHQKC